MQMPLFPQCGNQRKASDRDELSVGEQVSIESRALNNLVEERRVVQLADDRERGLPAEQLVGELVHLLRADPLDQRESLALSEQRERLTRRLTRLARHRRALHDAREARERLQTRLGALGRLLQLGEQLLLRHLHVVVREAALQELGHACAHCREHRRDVVLVRCHVRPDQAYQTTREAYTI